MKIKVNNKTVYIKDSDKPNKQKVAYLPNGKSVHFGEPTMPEYPGTKRGDNYCARSYGIGKKYNVLNDIESPNFWSRLVLWNCKGKKSLKKRP